MKLFDKVVLLLWGHLLSTDSLQFGYKVGTSTTQCSWLVTEVANHFLRQGTCPIITLLDCTMQLPWVESAVHLGHILHQSGNMDKDIRVKRATFIDESVAVREMCQFANPAEVLQAVKLYVGSHYGSMLWDLGIINYSIRLLILTLCSVFSICELDQ